MSPVLPKRRVGDDYVSAIGLGCMGMTHGYTSGGYDEEESLRVLTRAADMGITFWDTSDAYGPFTNEELLGKWFQQTGRRDEIFLATKFGVAFPEMTVRGDTAYVRKACDDSLKRLQTDRIDLYYQHRVDPNTPIEVTVRAMTELKKEGKIRYLGLSECSARTMRRAHMVHPITAVQFEFSPFGLDIESPDIDVLRTARELGITVVAYSPLGGGFLTGSFKDHNDLDETDIRRILPRFSEENFGGNLQIVNALSDIAKRRGCTPAQLSLAWVLAQGEDFIAIPGTKRVKYLEENAGAVNVAMDTSDEKQIREIINRFGGARGARYPPEMLAMCFGDTVELTEA